MQKSATQNHFGNTVCNCDIQRIKNCHADKRKQNADYSRNHSQKHRFSVKKSREMFVLIQSYYNPTNNVEKAIRIWNGGPRYKVRSTQGYYKRVMRAYNN